MRLRRRTVNTAHWVYVTDTGMVPARISRSTIAQHPLPYVAHVLTFVDDYTLVDVIIANFKTREEGEQFVAGHFSANITD